jgi:hypothetical protein
MYNPCSLKRNPSVSDYNLAARLTEQCILVPSRVFGRNFLRGDCRACRTEKSRLVYNYPKVRRHWSYCPVCGIAEGVSSHYGAFLGISPSKHELEKKLLWDSFTFMRITSGLRECPSELLYRLGVGQSTDDPVKELLSSFAGFTTWLGSHRSLFWPQCFWRKQPSVPSGVLGRPSLLIPICRYPGDIAGMQVYPVGYSAFNIFIGGQYRYPAGEVLRIFLSVGTGEEFVPLGSVSDIATVWMDILQDTDRSYVVELKGNYSKYIPDPII